MHFEYMEKKHSAIAMMTFFTIVFTNSILFSMEPRDEYPLVTFKWIKSVIESQNITTIDKLISVLPERYRKNFVLMKSSQSSQGATPERPRIIMFGDGDTTILSFNGDENQRGFDKIELMEFKKDSSQFELREIDFSNSKPQFSQANPPRCIKCHREKEARPNWRKYPNWPEAYGANDDILSAEETSSLKKFLLESPNLERYRHLIYDKNANLGPFSLEKKGDPRYRPNMRLTKLLVRLQAKSLYRQMKSSPHFKLHRDLIILRSEGGRYTGDVNESGFPFGHYSKPMDLYNPLRDIYKEANSYFNEISKEVGITQADWTLEFEPVNSKNGTWSYYSEGRAGMENFVLGELWRDLILDEPDLARFYRPGTDYPSYPWLDKLGSQVKSALFYGEKPNEELNQALLNSVARNQNLMRQFICSKFY